MSQHITKRFRLIYQTNCSFLWHKQQIWHGYTCGVSAPPVKVNILHLLSTVLKPASSPVLLPENCQSPCYFPAFLMPSGLPVCLIAYCPPSLDRSLLWLSNPPCLITFQNISQSLLWTSSSLHLWDLCLVASLSDSPLTCLTLDPHSWLCCLLKFPLYPLRLRDHTLPVPPQLK